MGCLTIRLFASFLINIVIIIPSSFDLCLTAMMSWRLPAARPAVLVSSTSAAHQYASTNAFSFISEREQRASVQQTESSLQNYSSRNMCDCDYDCDCER